MLDCLKPKDEEYIKSKRLDKNLSTWHKQFTNAVKILLLGTGESGKSTILKQMKILHINGYTIAERLEKVEEIRYNIHESITELVQYAQQSGLPFDHPNHIESVNFLLNATDEIIAAFDINYVRHVERLWNDSTIQNCYRKSNDIQIIDNAKYFFSKITEIAKIDYIPSVEDILYSRNITKTIIQITFTVKIPKVMGGGFQEFWMIDVGGQREQRNKWLQVFEGIQAVLFVISCADYDQTLREDNTKNRLEEAIELFRGVWLNRFLSGSGIIVFLNKVDILQHKLQYGSSIAAYYPEYAAFKVLNSGLDEFTRTKYFIRQKLMDQTRPANDLIAVRKCFYHFTIAVDTNNIRKVFNDVHHMILTENIASYGLI